MNGSGAKVNPSELTTTEGIVGRNDYVVNIQKYFTYKQDKEDRLIYAVGVLVDVQFILTSCSVFYDAAEKHISPEKIKYKNFRVVADGVIGHSTMVLDGRKLRFIDHVNLHPNCKKPAANQTKWTSDLAIVHTSFPFDLQPGIVGIIKFGHVEGGAKQLVRNRTRDLTEFHNQHKSVTQLGTNSAVCRVMSWGRRDTLFDGTGRHDLYASPKLLLYKVKLADENDCEGFCHVDDRFCQMKNTTNSSSVVCAYRGNVTFPYQGRDYSAYPCIGTEGSPLICHPPGDPGKADIYGIVANIPNSACLDRSLPIVVTHIEDVSRFVFEVVGKATKIQGTCILISLLFCILPSIRC